MAAICPSPTSTSRTLRGARGKIGNMTLEGASLDILWGLVIGLSGAGAAHVLGFDRDRSYYPTLMIVIAAIFILFAVMAVPASALLAEGLAATAFIALAIAGHRWSLWFVVVALLGHGVFDVAHAHLIANAAVPSWYPAFCGAADLALSASLAALILRGHLAADHGQGSDTSS